MLRVSCLALLLASFRLVSADGVANDDQNSNRTYDYVIVGGGTSGLVVANRLSENARRK
jgi:ribulose 1,5-bisphosphate synthetase/thiazole synthase